MRDVSDRLEEDSDKVVCGLQCLCELPESYEAYRKQQHRWHSGPMQLFRLCLPDIIKSKVRLCLSLVLFYFKTVKFYSQCLIWSCFDMQSMDIAAPGFKEGESDLPVLLAEEVDPSILLLHTVLCDLTVDDVCAGSAIASVGGVLHSSGDVLHEHPACTQILPIPDPISPVREHNVSDQVPGHDFRFIPAEQLAGVGGDQKVWPRI